MYCPKCGEEFSRFAGGEYTCLKGEMGLSPWMAQALTELIENTPVETTTKGIVKESFWSWYCPRCRDGLKNLDPQGFSKICPSCGLTLPNKVVNQLVELHPHQLSAEQKQQIDDQQKRHKEVGIKQHYLRKISNFSKEQGESEGDL